MIFMLKNKLKKKNQNLKDKFKQNKNLFLIKKLRPNQKTKSLEIKKKLRF